MMRLPSLFRTIQLSSGGYSGPFGSGVSERLYCIIIAPSDGRGYMLGVVDELKNGIHTFPSFLEAVEGNGVSDPVHSAPSPVPSASVNVTKRSCVDGRVVSKRGFDKADQKLILPIDVDDSKSLMRAAKLSNEQTISTCAIDKTLDKICTIT